MRTTMMTVLVTLSLSLLGCGRGEAPPQPRVPVTCNDLAVSVGDAERGFFYSDTRGGFLTGKLRRHAALEGLLWSADGTVLLDGLALVGESEGAPLLLDSARVLPQEAVLHVAGGTVCRLALFDGAGDGVHTLALSVRAGGPAGAGFRFRTDPRFRKGNSGRESGMARWDSPAGTLLVSGAGNVSVAGDRCVVPSSGSGTFVFVFGRRPVAKGVLDSLSAGFDRGVDGRRERMDALLRRAYFRTSDDTLTRGVNWLKLSLDALVVAGEDTQLVSGLPWDGSLSGRTNAQALGGLDFATGDYARTTALARAMMRWQDTVRTRPTYGRIAERVARGTASYGSADIAPWLIRECYDHVVRAKDSVLLRQLEPVLRRSLEGTYRYHTDALNLMTHGERETWMGPGSLRGNRACEQQLLWYLEQVIGSYVANFLGSWKDGQRYTAMADSTGRSFNRIFVDTARGEVCDHLRPDGTKVFEVRPNALLCLEVIGYERVQQEMLKRTFSTLTYPCGVGTLDPADGRFIPAPGQGDGNACNGPAWTWLAGPMGYALTRYDRQDLAYRMVRWMLLQALEAGTVGSLPTMFQASRHASEVGHPRAGSECSALAMAELIRTAYQDQLGIGFDAVSRVVTVQPKLPDHITDADVTVVVGDTPVRVLYEIRRDLSRLVMEVEKGGGSLKVNVVWMMKTGDAWKGSVRLSPGKRLTVVFGPDDAIAYSDDQTVDLGGKWKIRGYSRKKELGDLMFAPLPAP